MRDLRLPIVNNATAIVPIQGRPKYDCDMMMDNVCEGQQDVEREEATNGTNTMERI